jgi:SHS family lactate transporter-like MFS transporter
MSDNEKPTTDHAPVATRPAPVEEHLGDEPPHHGMSAGQYIASRFSSLKPPMSKLPSPFKLIMMLNGHHWAFFLVAFFAWVRLLLDQVTPSLAFARINKRRAN